MQESGIISLLEDIPSLFNSVLLSSLDINVQIDFALSEVNQLGTIMTMSVDEIGPFFKEELRQLDESDVIIFLVIQCT